MMKIIEGTGSTILQPKKNQPKTESGGGDFSKIMDQVKSPDGRNAKPASMALEPGFPPGGIQMATSAMEISKAIATGEADETAVALEKTIDLLDFYAAKLGDTTLELTEISPMIEHLEDRLVRLEEMRASPSLPDSLKTLLTETITVMGTEIAKFRRGDYA
jgi:hypothetical protein